jgi:hypothetical protein
MRYTMSNLVQYIMQFLLSLLHTMEVVLSPPVQHLACHTTDVPTSPRFEPNYPVSKRREGDQVPNIAIRNTHRSPINAICRRNGLQRFLGPKLL